ncbi:hypothetical protein FHG87_018866 [Trinorchestia longiramus]|nr:hypothetical protein FHG87_018866 [Trinorchestia longiramus]
MDSSLGSDPFSEEDMDRLLDDLDADDDGLPRRNPKSPQSSKTSSAVPDISKSPAKPSIKSPKSPDATSVGSTKETPKKVTFSSSAGTVTNDTRNTPSPKLDLAPTTAGSLNTSTVKRDQSSLKTSPDAKKTLDNMSGGKTRGRDLFDDADIFGSLEKTEKETKSSFMDSLLKGGKKEKSPSNSQKMGISFDEKFKSPETSQKIGFSDNPSDKKSAQKPGKSSDLDLSFLSSFPNGDGSGDRGNAGRRRQRGKLTTASVQNVPFIFDDSDITGVPKDTNVTCTTGGVEAVQGRASRPASRGSGGVQPVSSGLPGPGSNVLPGLGGGNVLPGPGSNVLPGPGSNVLPGPGGNVLPGPGGNVLPGLDGTGGAGTVNSSTGATTAAAAALPSFCPIDVSGLAASFEAQSNLHQLFLQQQQQAAQQLQLQLRQLEEQFTQQAQQQSTAMMLLSKQREEAVRRLHSALLNISNCSLPGQPRPPDDSSSILDPNVTSNPSGTATHPTGTATHPTATATHPTGTVTQPTGTATQPTATATQPTATATHTTGAATHPSGTATNSSASSEEAFAKCKKELDELVLKAQNEAQKLSSDLEALQVHHDQQIAFLTKSYEDKLKLSDELHEQKEKLLRQQSDQLVQHHERVLQLQQKQHEQQLQDMQRMKDIEVAAAERNAERNTEASSVVQRLHSNTAQLSELSSAVQQQGDAAQQVLQHALDAQKQQVSNLEAELAASKRAADAEHGRLTVMVGRLEERLTNEQAVVEEKTWRLQRKEAQLQEDIAAWQKKKETEQQNLAAATAKLEQQQKLLEQRIIRLKVQESMLAVGRQQKHEEHSTKPTADKDLQQGVFEERLRVLAEEKKKILLQMEKLSDEQAQLHGIKEGIERDKLEVVRLENNMQAKLEILQQEQQSLALQKQQQLAAAASLQQRLSQVHAATEAAHVVKFNAAKERDRAEAALQKLREFSVRGLCVRCGQPSVGAAAAAAAHSAASSSALFGNDTNAFNARSTAVKNALDAITTHPSRLKAMNARLSSSALTTTEVDYRPEAVLARLEATRAEDNEARF